MNDEHFNRLEKTLHTTLRGQPVLRAPSTLEQRVRAEIARQAARPWWRRSFAEWPVLVRAAFVALSGSAACISIAGTLAWTNGPGAALATSFLREASALRMATQSVVTSGGQILGTLSPGGWYLVGGVVATAYVGLLGLGATAYRFLWKAR